jgi:hypothetical protein
MTNEDKAKYYDQLLREHDQKASKVANLQNKIDLSREDKTEIKRLKQEMAEIQRKAYSLGTL